MKTTLAILTATIALAACGNAPPPAAPPAPSAALAPPPSTPTPSDGAPARQSPPSPLAAKPAPFPHVDRTKLANGLGVSVVASKALPVIELRVLVRAGMGYGAPGVAELTGEMLKQGGTRARTAADLNRRIETLGSSLGVDVGFDATTLSMRVVRGQLDEAMALLGEVVRAPRFDAGELAKLKERATDEAQENARSNGGWSTTRVVFHTLYPGASPYATYGVDAGEIAKVDGAAIREFHHRFYVPSNLEVVVAGDVDAAEARAAIEKAFGDWRGAAAPAKLVFAGPTESTAPRVIVAHRPKSVQSDVVVTQLFPERHVARWPAVRVALQVFGGGVMGRLFADVREKRSLAYRADARVLELAHGEQPLLAYAGTQAPKTADAVQGVLDDLASMRATPPSKEEVDNARRFLSEIFAVTMETIGSIADLVVRERALDLPEGYWDTYRAALRALPAADVVAQSAEIFHPDHALIVVSGDADVIAEPLARFGEVTIVDPEHDFRVVRTIPKMTK